MLHLYAFAEHPARAPAVRGIGGSTLQVLPVGESLDAVVGEVEDAAPSPTEDAILAHARVVQELAETTEAVLPARFARPLGDEAELAAVVREREAELRAALARVRGCAEVGVRVLDGGTTNESARTTGREYLVGRLQSVRAAEAVAADLDRALEGTARDHDVRVVAKDDLLLTAAYLVPRAQIEAVRASVDELASSHPTLTFVVTGPWPPYTFVTVEAAQA